jgi:hypothetical protein
MAGIYTVHNGSGGVVISTAITVLQYKAGAANKARLVRAHISQGLSETNTQEQIQILRLSTASTVTSFTPVENDPDGPAAFGVGGTSATGFTGSVEGTPGDVLVNEGFNILNGWTWVRSALDEIVIPAAGILAMKFPVAPASATWRAYMVIEEL